MAHAQMASAAAPQVALLDGSAPLPTDPSSRAATYPHGGTVSPGSVGLDGGVLQEVLESFRQQQRRGMFPGGQLAVRRYGKLVLDEAVGFARGLYPEEGVPLARVTPTTPFLVFSAGKPLIALAIAILEERGLLDVNAPVAEVFPEFGDNGKHHITTLDVLTHRGGFPMPDFVHRHVDWGDWDKVLAAVRAVRPSYRRGVLAYHPFEFGWVLAEVVQRLTGLSFSAFLEQAFTGPAGLRALHFGVRSDETDALARPYWLGRDNVRIGHVHIRRLFDELGETPEVMQGFVPGANLVGDAASLTALYDLLLADGVTASGERLLGGETIRRYTARHAYGFCRTNRTPLAVGRGFLVGVRGPSLYGWWDGRDVFGHAGAFCTVAFGDRRTGLSAAFVTNGNRGPADLVRRFVSMVGRVRTAAR